MIDDDYLDGFDYREVLTEEEIARAQTMTVDEVMEEGIHDLIKIAKYNGMDAERVEAVIMRVIDGIIDERRKQFKFV